MTFRNADKLEKEQRLDADICIVGAGAAGISLALSLENTKRRILVLESGDQECVPETHALDEMEIAGHPLNVGKPVRRRALGGTTIATYGRSVVLNNIDFEQRPWVSEEAWPISGRDLQCGYAQAASVLGLSQVEFLEVENCSDHPVVQAASEHELETRIHRFGRHVNLGETWSARLERSENITVLMRATAVSCQSTGNGTRIKEIMGRSLGGGRFSIRAKQFVLACGGLENPRLLLLFGRSARPPAINWDPVGRFYMNHPRSEDIGRVQLNQANPRLAEWARLLVMHREKGAGRTQFAFSPSEQLQREEELLNHCSFFYAVSDQKALMARRQLTFGQNAGLTGRLRQLASLGRHLPVLAHGALHQLQMKPFRPEYLVVVDQCEQKPDPQSRVLLGHETDRFGSPRLRLDWRIDTEVTRSLRRLHELLARFVTEKGIGMLQSRLLEETDFEPGYQDCAHPTGATRMSCSERQGVVDRDCRVHGMENLFVTGSSVFPVGGNANPTFSIIALSARLARTLTRGFSAGNSSVGVDSGSIPSTGSGSPLISVIVPAFNADRSISACLAGLSAQTIDPQLYEIIVVDNDSEDQTVRLVGQHPDVTLLQEKERGAYAARNRGVHASSGEILAFTDADCVPEPEWLVSIIQALRERDTQAVLGHRSAASPSSAARLWTDYEVMKEEFLFGSDQENLYYGRTNNMAVTRAVFEECGPFKHRLRGSDSLFICDVVNSKGSAAVRFDPSVIVQHLELTGTWSLVKKAFIYGRSQQSYGKITQTVTLSGQQRWMVFRNTARHHAYSLVQSIQLLGLLSLGTIGWYTGGLWGWIEEKIRG
jgi:choline dehydrogenase-like flavoprotein